MRNYGRGKEVTVITGLIISSQTEEGLEENWKARIQFMVRILQSPCSILQTRLLLRKVCLFRVLYS